jgi:hypothetical protein
MTVSSSSRKWCRLYGDFLIFDGYDTRMCTLAIHTPQSSLLTSKDTVGWNRTWLSELGYQRQELHVDRINLRATSLELGTSPAAPDGARSPIPHTGSLVAVYSHTFIGYRRERFFLVAGAGLLAVTQPCCCVTPSAGSWALYTSLAGGARHSQCCETSQQDKVYFSAEGWIRAQQHGLHSA